MFAKVDDPPRAGYSGNLLTIAFSAWLLGGLLTDVWAHNNVPNLETFFTPWHAALYSGFLATAAWICWLVRRNLTAGRRGMAAVPAGYALGAFGVCLFVVAGAGDLTWHTIFGIERNTRILFSPTHVLLVTAIILIVTSPLRDAFTDVSLPSAPSLRQLLPAVLAIAFATVTLMVLLQYANLLVEAPQQVVSLLYDTDGLSAGVGEDLLFTNLALLLPLLVLARRWRIPFGTATVLYTVFGFQAEAVRALGTPMVFVAVVLAGIGVDLLVAWLRRIPVDRVRFWAFGALAPVVTWAVYFAVIFASVGNVPPIVEYWTGMPVVAGMLGLALAALLLPGAGAMPTQPAPEPSRVPEARRT
ncbi:MAG TPA: hypothetical protein VH333_01765 [Pseudonocardiaceae bacterium]|jgi:hypothetical protein|nr:hypothetical protein [Pseudonocardiaceae bacterium]